MSNPNFPNYPQQPNGWNLPPQGNGYPPQPNYPQQYGGFQGPPNNGWNQPPKRGGGKAPAIILTIVAFVVVLFIGGGVVVQGWMQSEYDKAKAADEQWQSEQVVETPDPVTAPPSNTSGSQGVEAQWKSGEDWKTPPASMQPAQEFAEGYPTAQSFLDGIFDVTVVMTNDPEYNCGMDANKDLNSQTGGCYKRSYGNVLFMWFAPDSTADVRLFVLLHELGHYVQQWNEFDVMDTARAEGLGNDPVWMEQMEADASCRVFYQFGADYLLPLDHSFSASCSNIGNVTWTEDYLRNYTIDYGVEITDY